MHCWFCCSNPVDSSLSECRTRLSTDHSTLHQVAHARPLSIRAATLCAPLLLAPLFFIPLSFLPALINSHYSLNCMYLCLRFSVLAQLESIHLPLFIFKFRRWNFCFELLRDRCSSGFCSSHSF